jgi:hypothetical protein
MKTRALVATLFALTFAFAPRLFETSTAAPQQKGGGRINNTYAAKLISPKAGDVLVPGQQVRIEWESTLPRLNMTWCEQEIYLSLDGGKSNVARITPQLDPQIGYYTWTVPKTPSEKAVLDIHFGCEGYFNETASVQGQSAFVIVSDDKAQEVAINSVSPAQASPGDTVRVAWDSSVEEVKYFELLVSYDRGAHFQRLAKTKKLQFDWEVPDEFAGHATFLVVAHTVGGERVDSAVSAEPQLIVRARL